MKIKTGRTFSIIFVMVLLSTGFFSCRMKASASYFTDELVKVDELLSNNESKKAVKLLKALVSKASDGYEYLGLYKRFISIGDSPAADKCLLTGLKKLPDNIQLVAVYVYDLIKQERFQDAVKAAKILVDTEYCSLYAIAEFKLAVTTNNADNSLINSNKKEQANYWLDTKLIPAYNAASFATGNRAWARNAAICFSSTGDYQSAYKYHPEKLTEYDTPFFWACTAYDSGSLVACVNDLEKTPISPESILLKADAYILLGEESLATLAWQTAIDNWPDASPVMYVNAARSASLSYDAEERGVALFQVVQKFPDYIPGLVDYGRLALESSFTDKDDSLTAAIRAGGLRTIEMSLAENSLKIPISDALYRMESSLERKNDAALLVEYTKLKWKQPLEIGGDATDGKQKIVDMWHILEANMTGADEYPPYLVRYAVWLFLQQHRDEDAVRLFEAHLARRYGVSVENAGQMLLLKEKLEPWECEDAAWFAASAGDYQEAVTFYEFLISGYHELYPELAGGSEFLTPVSALLNLGSIYCGFNRRDEALALYTRASGKTSDNGMRSEIQYRMALIQAENGDTAGALSSAEYAVMLNPDNSKARLFLKRMKI